MVAVVAALFDETWELIRRLEIDKSSPVTHYRGKISGVEIALLLVKPGFRKKKEFLRWLQSGRFERLINIGLAGALRNDLSLGHVCPIGRVSHGKHLFELPQSHQRAPEGAFHVIQTDSPVFSYDEKEDLRLRSGADLVDMESGTLLELTTRPDQNKDELQPEIIKIIGDAMGDERFLGREQAFRGWFSTFGWRHKLKIAREVGLSFFPLYFRKRKLQRIIFSALLNALAHPPEPPSGGAP